MSGRRRLLITVFGCVQGVGFRPFVYRLAVQHHLAGSIKNTSSGVKIDVQGEPGSLIQFQKEIVEKKPERSSISHLKVEEAAESEAKSFEISPSSGEEKTELALLPDTAICAECLHELFDPKNRRHRYPFLHCMTCGPRFSLFLRMPFDRGNTAMIDFPMCGQCVNEYENPLDRRFYSQTNCCPNCGPELKLLDPKQKVLAKKAEAIDTAVEFLKQGKIVALKNTGGFLLLVDAMNEDAVRRLRLLKRRAKKPFAVLMPTLVDAEKMAYVDEAAGIVMTSPAAPIVLLKKKNPFAPSVSCESPYYGVMLAHNALQHLLGSQIRALVATSGNRSGGPVCIREEEAFSQLEGIADVFLVHNRRIIHRIDDSVVQIIDGRPMLIRRARGYIPFALEVPEQFSFSQCILGAGGHQKNCFAFAKGQKIYLSQHIGDLDSSDGCRAYEQEVRGWETLLNEAPCQGVGDLHPNYFTSRFLQEKKLPAVSIQHHRAHVCAGMIDQNLSPPFLSISWDGTGFGEDQTIWGGEAFLVTEKGINRFATLEPFLLPGSEKAVREPRRSLMGVLYALFGSNIPHIKGFSSEEFSVLLRALEKKINAPLCSSMGRLFDAVSALLECCLISDYEGEAALALESLASKSQGTSFHLSFSAEVVKNIWMIEWRDVIKKMLECKSRGIPPAEIALAFHNALAELIVQLAQKAGGENVLLTGGCMQNKLLAEAAIAGLRRAGFKPFWHSRIPPNDGGLAVGQIIGKLFEGKL